MKKEFLVLLMIAIAIIGIVSANVSTLPVGESGFYDVTSSPSGAAVTVDSTPSGTTPTTVTVIVGASGHTIAVNKAGFEPWSKYFEPRQRRHYRLMQSWSQCRLQHRLQLLAARRDTTRSLQTQPGEVYYIRWDELWENPGHHYRKYLRDSRSHHHGLQIRLPDLEPVLFRESGCRSDSQRFCHPQPGCPHGNILVNSVPSGASAILDNGYDRLTTAETFTAVRLGMAQRAGFKIRVQASTQPASR